MNNAGVHAVDPDDCKQKLAEREGIAPEDRVPILRPLLALRYESAL